MFRQACKFVDFPFANPSNHEVMASVGNIKGIPEKVAVVTCYMPPNLSLAIARDEIEYISDLIAELKRVHNNCVVVLGGDFN